MTVPLRYPISALVSLPPPPTVPPPPPRRDPPPPSVPPPPRASLLGMTRERNPQRKTEWIAAVAAEQGEGCRDWPWGVDGHGYPQMRLHTRVRKVAHVVLATSGRERPPGLVSLHACDRPVCLAPWHLRWGTQGENMQEKVERGRARGRNSR